MGAQFFSALADNALLLASIAMLRDLYAPAEAEPLLKLFFVIPYVILAAFVGAFADAVPKGRVMLFTNSLKLVGCLLLLSTDLLGWNVDFESLFLFVLVFYALVGLGAAAYSPAKYGILTELLPHNQLVLANGWIEALTVVAIIAGTLLGSWLITDRVASSLVLNHLPDGFFIDTQAEAAVLLISAVYAVAALLNLMIPNTGVALKPVRKNLFFLVGEFSHCVRLLWKDKLGQITLAVTTLFWGAGAVLQFIIIKWGETVLGMPLEKSSILQAFVAVGIMIGAAIAAKCIPLNRAMSVLPVGAAMGLAIFSMVFITSFWPAQIILFFIGLFGGLFVVPMNAMLQHRGHVLMGAGHSIAVQNFNENLSILVMLGGYAVSIYFDLSVQALTAIFGLGLALTVLLVHFWYRKNLKEHGSQINGLLSASVGFSSSHATGHKSTHTDRH